MLSTKGIFSREISGSIETTDSGVELVTFSMVPFFFKLVIRWMDSSLK